MRLIVIPDGAEILQVEPAALGIGTGKRLYAWTGFVHGQAQASIYISLEMDHIHSTEPAWLLQKGLENRRMKH
eukprot:984798-Pelagomonas_calceolata.AAC.1